ncbi:MAG: hypothetical protein WD544_01555, partial [Patescibacteria group bacterium]
PGLTQRQLAVAKELSEQYLTGFGDIVFRLVSSLRPISIEYPTQAGQVTFYQGGWESRVEYYRQISQKYQEVLVIFPTNQHLKAFVDMINDVIVLDGSAATRRKITAVSGKAIFVGTVGDTFFPLNGKSLIIIDQPEHIGSRYSNRPALKSEYIAQTRARLEGTELIIGQPLISFSQLLKVKNHTAKLVAQDLPARPVSITSRLGSAEILLPTVVEKITDSLNAQERICLFVASKGWASGYFCRNCQQLVTCANCRRVTAVNQDKLICRYCAHEQLLPNKCPNCQKEQLVELGEGIDKVADAIKNAFPEATRQVIAGKSNIFNDRQITIGTEKLLSFPQQKFAKLFVISADRALTGSQLDDQWRLLSVLRELSSRVNQVIVQTYLLESRVWQALNQKNLRQYFSAELSERRAYKLPPYYHCLKLIGQGHKIDYLHIQVEELLKVVKKFSTGTEYSLTEQTDNDQEQLVLQLIIRPNIYPRLRDKLADILAPNWSAIPG